MHWNTGASQCLLAGALLLLFGGGGLLALFVVPICFAAGVSALREPQRTRSQTWIAWAGLASAVLSIILAFGYHYYGLIWETFLKSYLP